MPAVSKKQQRFFGYLLSNPDERKKRGISKKAAKDFAQSVDEALERQAKDRTKLSQPHSVSGSRRDHSHDVDSALTDHVPGKGKGRIRKASKKEMRVSAMRDAGIKEEKDCPAGHYFCFDRGKCMPIPKGKKVRGDGELVNEVSPPGWGHTKAEKEKTKPWKPKSKIGGSADAFKKDLDSGKFKGLPGSKTKKEKTADMFKIMWAAKKKGYKPHYKPGTDKKYKKYQKESTMPNVDPKDRKVIKDRVKTLFKKDLKGDVRGVNEDSESASNYQKSLSVLDRHRGPEAQKDLAKKIGKRRRQKAELARLLRHYSASRSESDVSDVNEGKTWKDFKRTIDTIRGKKQEKKKPQMDATTRKLHKWRTDKEQAEREKYVSPFKPVEDD